MASIYYCSTLDRIILLTIEKDVVVWDYGLDRKYVMSRSQSIFALTAPMYDYQFIGLL